MRTLRLSNTSFFFHNFLTQFFITRFLNMTEGVFSLLIQILSHPYLEARVSISSLRIYQTCYDPENYQIAFKKYLKKANSIYESTHKNKKISIKQERDHFFKRLDTVKANAKIAHTIFSILTKHSEFKSKKSIHPWTQWKHSKDLLDHFRANNLKLENVYANLDLEKKITRPKQ